MRTLHAHAQDYLRLRRSLGHDLADAGRLLPRFVCYLDAVGAQTVTITAALAWAQEQDAAAQSSVWPRRMTVARGFARYMSGVDPRTEIPPIGLLPSRQRWRAPFIYTPAEIDALMLQARRSIRPALRAATFETLIGLLASTGMRVGEAIRLDRADIDWAEGVLLVRQSKFLKTRIVPVSASTLTALAGYAKQRDAATPHPAAPSFFISGRGTRLIYTVIGSGFRTLCDAAGIGVDAPLPPRIHDLRHTFAVRTLLAWYHAGDDVDARLPSLATYLGHRDPRSTYWYLSAAPELLALAATRLEAAPSAVAR